MGDSECAHRGSFVDTPGFSREQETKLARSRAGKASSLFGRNGVVSGGQYVGHVHLRYSFRIEPTPGQRIALARTFGCARVVYNDALAARKAAYQADKSRIATGVLARRVITEAKRTPERAWLAEVSVDALQSSSATWTPPMRTSSRR